eukprot:Gb_10482 [translate_table: standard]
MEERILKKEMVDCKKRSEQLEDEEVCNKIIVEVMATGSHWKTRLEGGCTFHVPWNFLEKFMHEGHDFMGGIQAHRVAGLSLELLGILKFILNHVEDKVISSVYLSTGYEAFLQHDPFQIYGLLSILSKENCLEVAMEVLQEMISKGQFLTVSYYNDLIIVAALAMAVDSNGNSSMNTLTESPWTYGTKRSSLPGIGEQPSQSRRYNEEDNERDFDALSISRRRLGQHNADAARKVVEDEWE